MVQLRTLFVLLVGLFVTGAAQAQAVTDVRTLLDLLKSSPTPGYVEIASIDPVSSMAVEDQQGYMWFDGVESTIYRYDGYDFVAYRHNPQDSTSLLANTQGLYVDHEGTLWIGGHDGLSRYNRATDAFTRFLHDPDDPTSLSQDSVTAILEDSQGTLWVGTRGRGLNRLDKETGTFTVYRHDPNDETSLSNDAIQVLYEDSGGVLWVGTGRPGLTYRIASGGGLNRFDSVTETFTRYLHEQQDETSLISNKVLSIYEDSRGVFYVGTMGDGLHTMDREAGTFTRHRYDPGDPTKLSRPFLEGTKMDESCTGWACGGVSFIHEDGQGQLWIGGMHGGVNRYELETGAMSHHEAGSGGLFDNTVWSIAESRDGTLWIGNWNGMHKVVSSVNTFVHVVPEQENANDSGILVTDLLEDREGMLWISTVQNGLYRLNPSTGLYTHFLHDPDDAGTLGQNNGFHLYEDRSGAVWVTHGAQGGLSQYNRSTDRFIRYESDPEDPASLSHNSVKTSILEDGQGRLWVGTANDGLNMLDRETGRVFHNRHDVDDPESLSNNSIASVYEDASGTIWVATSNGLNSLVDELQSGIAFKKYLTGRFIQVIYEDSQGRFWVGTRNNGLYLFDSATGKSIRYGLEKGIHVSIVGLVEDDEGNLWIGSTLGGIGRNTRSGRISRFDPNEGSFINFNTQDGLPEMGFHLSSALKSRSGRLLFGGMPGIVAFDPKSIRETERRPGKLSLTDLHVFNERVVPGPDAPLERPIYQTEEIRLTAAQNNFTIDYNAFSFRDANQTQYQYRLDGYDADWVEARTSRSARYAGLSPGSYVFRVRATDSRGLQTEEASIRVVMLPPWWRTWWAYTVFGLLFAGGVYGVDWFQRRRLLRKARENARERELAHAAEIKQAHIELQQAHDDLHKVHENLKSTQQQLIQQEKLASLGQLTAGIAHEIKNPLNFVNNFAGLITDLVDDLRSSPDSRIGDEQETLDTLQMNAQKIHEHGRRADRIVESMMQHASGGAGERKMMEINAFVEEYVNLALHSWQMAGRDTIYRVPTAPGCPPTIVRQYDEGAGTIELVPQEIGQVLVNLFNNAFDAVSERGEWSEEGGGAFMPEIAVSTKRQDGMVEIRVSDNGPGIPDQVRDRVFEPFFTTKPTGSGTGLGLSLSYDIVTQGHGGRLEVKSEKGKGATFIITLPV